MLPSNQTASSFSSQKLQDLSYMKKKSIQPIYKDPIGL